MAFIEKNGRPTCQFCGYELSAMVADNEVEDHRCECKEGSAEFDRNKQIAVGLMGQWLKSGMKTIPKF